MNKLFGQDHISFREWLLRILHVLVSVVIIVWFLPRDEAQHFLYDQDRPWKYGSLIATFDFPVYKSEEAVKAEQDSVLATLRPYYNLDPSVERTQVNRFLADFSKNDSLLNKQQRTLVANELRALYKNGILDTPDYGELFKDSTSMIHVVSGKQAQPTRVAALYSTLTAYDQLFHNERLAPWRQLLKRCNLSNYIEPNIIHDKERTEEERTELLGAIPLASGMVITGQKIIDRGELVTPSTYLVLESYERELNRRNATSNEVFSTLAGQAIYVLVMIVMLTLYLILFRQDYYEKPRNITMLYTLITIFPVLVSLMVSHNVLSIYILPIAMVPMFVRVFMDSRTAFMAHVANVLLCAVAVRYQYEFIIVQVVAGLAAIFSLRELSQRAQVFKSALLIALSSAAIYFALQLIQTNDVLKMDTDMYKHFIFNGILLLLSYPLMYLIEKTFGFVSDVTLFELSNTNRGVLRDLSEVAPGTFQHSITVGNLAAAIANKIGANALLVRTGALYHDIGKMSNPVFFTENQAGVNPHDNIPYTESARIIINHVTEGVKIAERNNLPELIKDFIRTHHGHGMTGYFYIKHKNEHPDEEVSKEPFTYPYPNPFTREQALLMMSDAVEAASRSLNEYTNESIAAFVNKIVDGQVTAGYFRECPITFRDIAQAKLVLIDRLKSIFHTRIAYPELKKGVNAG